MNRSLMLIVDYSSCYRGIRSWFLNHAYTFCYGRIGRKKNDEQTGDVRWTRRFERLIFVVSENWNNMTHNLRDSIKNRGDIFYRQIIYFYILHMIHITLKENDILIRNIIYAFNYAFNIVHTYKICNKILCKDRSVILFLYFILLYKNYILLYLHFAM